MTAALAVESQLDALAEFADYIRARLEDGETDEEMAALVDEMSRGCRSLGLPEWKALAALAGLIRQGPATA